MLSIEIEGGQDVWSQHGLSRDVRRSESPRAMPRQLCIRNRLLIDLLPDQVTMERVDDRTS